MGKTGGGRGTNQHKIQGASNSRGGNTEPENQLNRASPGSPDWSSLLAEYPTHPGDYQAVPEPTWADFSSRMSEVAPKGMERSVNRYVLREGNTVFNDARLEGFAFTEPEIATLISGGHVAGHTEGEEAQVAGLKTAGSYMLNRVMEGAEIDPAQAISDDIHRFIAAPLGLKSLAFRGSQKSQYEGPRVRLGRGEEFRALDARLTPTVLESGLKRIEQLDHPIVRGATWAAFATYEQFYLDGNKRTGRYVMNAVLMSHGYDAILIPASLKSKYEDVLVESYRSGDLTPHIDFLLGLYGDD
jgi:hypothetical protein